jgi:hypothetical protein
MGTRSFVGVMLPSGIFRAVYVHFDGYLEGVGAELQVYKTQTSVEELINRGDRSSLDSGYYRDRGEDDVDPLEYGSFDEFFKAVKDAWGEYYYIFNGGVWYCGNTYVGSKLYRSLVPYAEAVKTEGSERGEDEE